jgi:hypothetical protein
MLLRRRAGQTVGENVDPALIAHTALLIGMAAGRASEASVAADDFAGTVTALARGWNADSARGTPNDQDRRTKFAPEVDAPANRHELGRWRRTHLLR